jgi:RecG-like helicase
MAIRQILQHLRTPIEQLDRESLRSWTSATHATAIADVVPRKPVQICGEISSVRIVPRAGSPSLQVTVTDGTGFASAVFLGRRRIRGLTPGRRISLEGVAGHQGRVFELLNPRYEFLTGT